MSNVESQQNTSIGSYALMPSIYVGTNMVNNARHFKNLIKPYAKGFEVDKVAKDFNAKKFGELTIVKNAQMDTFQRAQFASESYEAVRSVGISYQKAAKKSAKLQAIQDGLKKISIKDKFFNLFRRKENKINDENLGSLLKKANEAKDTAAKNLDEINNAKNVTQLRETLERVDEGFKNQMQFVESLKIDQGALKSFGTQTWGNFKKEFSFKKGNRMNAGFNVAMTALQFIPNIFQKVVPAFKNNGFKAGMTELGQTVVQAGADLVSYAAGGAVGRTIGSAIGALITPLNPIGAWVGGLVGDMVCSMFVGNKVCGVVEKITNKDDAKNTGVPQENDQIAQLSAPQAQIPQEATVHLDVDNQNLTAEQVKELAYAQAFPKVAAQMNGYYA